MAPPSELPKIAARSEPTASITARTSSMRSSRLAMPVRSDSPVPPLVEHDEARERRQAPEVSGLVGVLPLQLEVRDKGRHVDEVDRAVAEHLVGDVDLTATRVVRWGR